VSNPSPISTRDRKEKPVVKATVSLAPVVKEK
jgi:hypothetical protein